jgi:hypothetical protein
VGGPDAELLGLGLGLEVAVDLGLVLGRGPVDELGQARGQEELAHGLAGEGDVGVEDGLDGGAPVVGLLAGLEGGEGDVDAAVERVALGGPLGLLGEGLGVLLLLATAGGGRLGAGDADDDLAEAGHQEHAEHGAGEHGLDDGRQLLALVARVEVGRVRVGGVARDGLGQLVLGGGPLAALVRLGLLLGDHQLLHGLRETALLLLALVVAGGGGPGGLLGGVGGQGDVGKAGLNDGLGQRLGLALDVHGGVLTAGILAIDDPRHTLADAQLPQEAPAGEGERLETKKRR